MSKLKAARIRIRNVMGIESIELEPGKLTRIEGENGQGKTSFITAIRSVVDGGHDPTLLRRGADEGEVYILLEDGTEISKRILPDRSPLTVKHPTMGRVGAAQTAVNALANPASVNPVAFILADPRKRAEWLLEALPMEVSAEELTAAVAGAEVKIPRELVESRGHALTKLGQVRQLVYTRRTEVNGEAKRARTTAEQLEAALPEDARSAEEIETEAAEVAAEKRRIVDAAKTKADAIKVERDSAVAEYEQAIRELQDKVLKAKSDAAQRLEALRADTNAAIAPHSERLAVLETAAKNASRVEATRETAAKNRADAEALEQTSSQLTQALSRIDQLKVDVLARLPLPGIEVRDGDIYMGETPFDRLNRAKQVEISMAVAKLRAGDLPILCLDGAECLDAKTFEALTKWVARNDVQVFLTEVRDAGEDFDGRLRAVDVPVETAA